MLAADADVLKSKGLPRLEGTWQGGGIHVVGPDPAQPEKLWTERDEDIVQAKDGTFGRTVPDDYKAPALCKVEAADPVKWRDAKPIAVAVAEPLEDPGDVKPIEEQPADVGQLKGP